MSTEAPNEKTTVLFLGPKGTYSHQAALQQFSHLKNVEYLPAQSIPECFEQLEKNTEISYSAVPLENSTNGQVVFSYDLLRDRMLDDSCVIKKHRVIPKLEIIGEQYVSITHCLISSYKNLKLQDLSSYKLIRIHSHPQVWGQVSNYMKKLIVASPNTKFETIDTNSTSKAVLIATKKQEGIDLSSREVLNIAIAGETAAHLYNGTIIDNAINDKKGNTTRFLILKRVSDPEYLTPSPNSSRTDVSLLMFTLGLDDPGSLVDVLIILKEYSVNMSSISSRPYDNDINNRKWQYIFYIEYDFDPEGKDMDSFYSKINDRCVKWCLWGTFPRNERYYQ